MKFKDTSTIRVIVSSCFALFGISECVVGCGRGHQGLSGFSGPVRFSRNVGAAD